MDYIMTYTVTVAHITCNVGHPANVDSGRVQQPREGDKMPFLAVHPHTRFNYPTYRAPDLSEHHQATSLIPMCHTLTFYPPISGRGG